MQWKERKKQEETHKVPTRLLCDLAVALVAAGKHSNVRAALADAAEQLAELSWTGNGCVVERRRVTHRVEGSPFSEEWEAKIVIDGDPMGDDVCVVLSVSRPV